MGVPSCAPTVYTRLYFFCGTQFLGPKFSFFFFSKSNKQKHVKKEEAINNNYSIKKNSPIFLLAIFCFIFCTGGICFSSFFFVFHTRNKKRNDIWRQKLCSSVKTKTTQSMTTPPLILTGTGDRFGRHGERRGDAPRRGSRCGDGTGVARGPTGRAIHRPDQRLPRCGGGIGNLLRRLIFVE